MHEDDRLGVGGHGAESLSAQQVGSLAAVAFAESVLLADTGGFRIRSESIGLGEVVAPNGVLPALVRAACMADPHLTANILEDPLALSGSRLVGVDGTSERLLAALRGVVKALSTGSTDDAIVLDPLYRKTFDNPISKVGSVPPPVVSDFGIAVGALSSGADAAWLAGFTTQRFHDAIVKSPSELGERAARALGIQWRPHPNNPAAPAVWLRLASLMMLAGGYDAVTTTRFIEAQPGDLALALAASTGLIAGAERERYQSSDDIRWELAAAWLAEGILAALEPRTLQADARAPLAALALSRLQWIRNRLETLGGSPQWLGDLVGTVIEKAMTGAPAHLFDPVRAVACPAFVNTSLINVFLDHGRMMRAFSDADAPEAVKGAADAYKQALDAAVEGLLNGASGELRGPPKPGLVVIPARAIPQITGNKNDQNSIVTRYGKLCDVVPFAGGEVDLDRSEATLLSEFPSMADAIRKIMNDARLVRSLGVKAFWFRPILLVGPSGVGKSRFARRLAEEGGVPWGLVGGAGSTDNRSLQGTSRGWSTHHPSYVVSLMADRTCSNPLVLVDEIEKAATGSRTNGSIHDTLLSMLEPETAGSWHDECLGTAVDLRRVSWCMTANTVDGIPGPLLNRVSIVHVGKPEGRHIEHIVDGMKRDIAREFGVSPDMMPDLDEAAIARLRRIYEEKGNLRDVRGGLHDEIAAAAGFNGLANDPRRPSGPHLRLV